MWAIGCYIFSLDPVEKAATAYARFFNPTVGIYEDSATGTAAGPLSAQLVAQAWFRMDPRSSSNRDMRWDDRVASSFA
jgi:predicted PhzF superfamily epimerase YddE/YHI9